MKTPRTQYGLIVYATNGDAYSLDELKEIINRPPLRWIKIEPGCEWPEDGERVAIVVPYKFSGQPTFVSADYCADNLWFADDDGFRYARQVATHWARVELPE